MTIKYEITVMCMSKRYNLITGLEYNLYNFVMIICYENNQRYVKMFCILHFKELIYSKNSFHKLFVIDYYFRWKLQQRSCRTTPRESTVNAG